MAAISSFPSSLSCRTCRGSSTLPCFPSFPSLSTPPFPSFPSLNLRRTERRKPLPVIGSAVAAVADEETLIAVEEEGKESPPSDDPVSVPVSPSDMLTMLFKAEGMMDESAVPTVSKTLQETEGVSDLKVQIAEGIATVELTKQTTVQATGVASSLVETIQGLGFRLQTLNLSFEDEEDAAK